MRKVMVPSAPTAAGPRLGGVCTVTATQRLRAASPPDTSAAT